MAKVSKTPKTFKVTITNVGAVVETRADQTILQAAIAAGIDFPYACASGNCGTCVCQLDAGKVAMLPRNDAALSPEQAKAGQTLACRARPKSDATVTWLGRGHK